MINYNYDMHFDEIKSSITEYVVNKCIFIADAIILFNNFGVGVWLSPSQYKNKYLYINKVPRVKANLHKLQIKVSQVKIPHLTKNKANACCYTDISYTPANAHLYII